MKRVGFHDEVGQQFLTGRVYFLAGLGFGIGLEGHGDVATDSDIVNARQVEVFHIVDHCFALWVKQFAVGHNVDFGSKLHVCVDL